MPKLKTLTDKVTAKIFAPDVMPAWRANSASDDAVAVVTGNYDLLQPGNLSVVRQAAALGARVVVVLQADGWNPKPAGGRQPRHETALRAEFVAHLRDVAAVTAVSTLNQADGLFAALTPFTLVTAKGHQTVEPLEQQASDRSVGVVAVEALAGCDTVAVEQAIRTAATPLRLPPGFARWVSPEPGNLPPAAPAGGRVTVNGCFDVLHLGHLRFLAAAADMGAELVVLINDDASVERYKGAHRPVFPLSFRRTALCALEGVTAAVGFAADDPLDALALWRPARHIKGGSYDAERVRTEAALLAQWGGQIAFCPLSEGFSTTAYVRRVLADGNVADVATLGD